MYVCFFEYEHMDKSNIYIYICIDIFHNGVTRDVVVIAE